MTVAVLTDSTSDLTPELAGQYGIHLVHLHVKFDGRGWLDHKNLSNRRLFQRVSEGVALPSTTPPTTQEYRDRLETLLADHDHVLAVHLSSKLSDTCDVAGKAARAFPGRVTVHDSRQSSGALAFQAERAVRLLGQGLDPHTVCEALTAAGEQTRTVMSLSTLSYLQKNRRISPAAAFGGILNLKPIVGLQGGSVAALARPVGTGRAQQQMRALLRDHVQHQPESRVALFHNGNLEGIEALRDEAHALNLDVPFTLELGTVLSAHGGPGVYGFSAEPVTVWNNFNAY